MEDSRRNINNNFRDARRRVEEGELNFKLTQIELVELHNLVKLTTEIYLQGLEENISGRQKINPEAEAAWIFLNNNYGTQFRRLGDGFRFGFLRSNYKKDLGYDPFSEFFKKRQDEMHHKFTLY